MTHLGEIKTDRNIMEAYEAECRGKWLFRTYADEAAKEGKENVAKLFRATALSAEIHAKALLRSLSEISTATNELWKAGMYDPKLVKDSVEKNLREAIGLETAEFDREYPRMIREAVSDGRPFVAECFTHLKDADRSHVDLFQKALNEPSADGSFDYYVCEGCGNTVEKRPSKPCGICSSSESAFKKAI